MNGKLFVGIKYGKDGTNAAMSIAVKAEEKIFVESLGCRPVRAGSKWIIGFLSKAKWSAGNEINPIIIGSMGMSEHCAGYRNIYLPAVPA